jgi:hypothetical protein
VEAPQRDSYWLWYFELMAVKSETGPEPQLQQLVGSISQSLFDVQAWMSSPAPPPLPAAPPVPPIDVEPALLKPATLPEPAALPEPPRLPDPAKTDEPATAPVPPAPCPPLSKAEPPHATTPSTENGRSAISRSVRRFMAGLNSKRRASKTLTKSGLFCNFVPGRCANLGAHEHPRSRAYIQPRHLNHASGASPVTTISASAYG